MKLSQQIKEIEKEFEKLVESYRCNGAHFNWNDNQKSVFNVIKFKDMKFVKQFYRQAIKEIIKEVLEDVYNDLAVNAYITKEEFKKEYLKTKSTKT